MLNVNDRTSTRKALTAITFLSREPGQHSV